MNFASFYGQGQRPAAARTAATPAVNLPFNSLFTAGRRVANPLMPKLPGGGQHMPVGDTGPWSIYRRMLPPTGPVDETGYLPRTGNPLVNQVLGNGGKLWNPYAQAAYSGPNPMAMFMGSGMGGMIPAPFRPESAPYVPPSLGGSPGYGMQSMPSMQGRYPGMPIDVTSMFAPKRIPMTTDV